MDPTRDRVSDSGSSSRGTDSKAYSDITADEFFAAINTLDKHYDGARIVRLSDWIRVVGDNERLALHAQKLFKNGANPQMVSGPQPISAEDAQHEPFDGPQSPDE